MSQAPHTGLLYLPINSEKFPIWVYPQLSSCSKTVATYPTKSPHIYNYHHIISQQQHTHTQIITEHERLPEQHFQSVRDFSDTFVLWQGCVQFLDSCGEKPLHVSAASQVPFKEK